MPAKYTKEQKLKIQQELIQKSNERFNFRYDYSNVVFERKMDKVEIICPDHGSFHQSFYIHLTALTGCQKCAALEHGDQRSMTTSSFIERAIEKHGSTYDYSNVKIHRSNTKIPIRCKIHGLFHQIPSAHLSGSGCPTCGSERAGKKSSVSFSDFISRANAVHGSFYIYEESEYHNKKEPITIRCPDHGPFKQDRYSHLIGTRCPECAWISRGLTRRSNTEEFIDKAKLVHGDKYNYDLVSYTHGRDSVSIVCPDHGVFHQMPEKHLSGNGCQECGRECRVGTYTMDTIDRYTGVEGTLYHISIIKNGRKSEKVGVTKVGVRKRFARNSRNGYRIKIIDEIHGDIPFVFELEQKILDHMGVCGARYTEKHLKSDFEGWTECFAPDFFNLSDFYQEHMEPSD